MSINSSPPPKVTSSELDRLIRLASSSALKKARQRLLEIEQATAFSGYEQDPVGFGVRILGENFTDDIQKVMESVRDNPVTIARSCTGPGKSHAAARIAVWFYKVFLDSKVYITAAPPIENLKLILWSEVMSVVETHPQLFAGHKVHSLIVQRGKKSFMTGVAIPTSGTAEEREAKFSGKHAPHMLFIVDEGDAVPDEVYKGIDGCMSGGFVRLLIMFNPKAQSGPVYLREKNRQANVIHLSAFNHPNVVTGQDLIPGAVDRQITVRRINEWTRPLVEGEKAGADTFEVPGFLVGAVGTALDGSAYPPIPAGLRKITESSFSYKVLGDYPAEGEQQLISQVWIDNAVSRYLAYVAVHGELPPQGISPRMGLDVADLGTDDNVACFRYGGFVPPFLTWRGIDVDASATRALTLYLERGADLALVDATGVGAGVAPNMARRGRERDVRAVSVKVAESPLPFIKTELGEFQQLRDQLWWAVREWLRTDPGAMLPPDGFLIEELRTPTYEIQARNGKVKVMDKDRIRALLHRSPNRADALCLTFAPFVRASVLSLDRRSNG